MVRRTLPVVVVVSLLAGCGTSPSPAREAADRHERAYLDLRRREECARDEGRWCCERLKARLDRALAADDARTIATAADALAISCPQLHADALAALEERRRPMPAPESSGTLALGYTFNLGAGDRLYWVGAFVDGRHSPDARLPPGAHVLEVEVHVMTGTGRDAAIARLRAETAVNIEAQKSSPVTVVVERRVGVVGRPLSLRFVEPRPEATATAGGGGGPRQPVLRKGGLSKVGAVGLPGEFSGHGRSWLAVARICVSGGGKLQSVRPIGPAPHPRHVATVLELARKSTYETYAVDGRPVPFCFPLRIVIN